MIRRIVVGYDFTEASDDALSWALELAQPLQATVHVVHIADSSDDSDPNVVERRAALARVADDAGPRVTSQLALGSDVAQALIDLSEEGNADLIVSLAVMGFGLGAIARLTGRLGTSIVAHALFNCIQLALLWLTLS